MATIPERGARRPGEPIRARTADLARRLAPGARTAGFSATGNVPVVRTAGGDNPLGPIATGGQNFFQSGNIGGGSGAAAQLFNPFLTQQQTGAVSAVRKSVAAGGLIGGAANFASSARSQSFLAANRLQGLRDVTGQVRSRLEDFRGAVNPLIELIGSSQAALSTGSELGGVAPTLLSRQNFSRELLGSNAGVDAIFSGLTSLNRGGVAQGALFSQLGNVSQGLRGNLDATDENALLLAATQQFLNPTLSSSQLNDPRTPTGQPGGRGGDRAVDVALNKLRGGAVLSSFFQNQLSGLNQGLAELETFGGGLAARAAAKNPEDVLGADVSQFQGLLQSVGLLLPDARSGENRVGSSTKRAFLNQAENFRNIISPIAPQGPTFGNPGIRLTPPKSRLVGG